jgi:phage repressor protein C with HTH and peptisase S24 domain
MSIQLVSSRLGSYRQSLGDSFEQFSERTGLPVSTLKKYEGGHRAPGSDAIYSLAQSGVNVHWLITGQGPMLSKDLPRGESREGLYVEKADDFVYIDALNVEVAAGHGATSEPQMISSRMAFRRDWLKRESLEINKLCVVRARGDSMEPSIESGDSLLVTVFIGHELNELKSGTPASETSVGEGLYILRLDDGPSVKRLQQDYEGGVFIKSDNPAYDTVHVTKKAMSNLTIIGKVEWVGRRL